MHGYLGDLKPEYLHEFGHRDDYARAVCGRHAAGHRLFLLIWDGQWFDQICYHQYYIHHATIGSQRGTKTKSILRHARPKRSATERLILKNLYEEPLLLIIEPRRGELAIAPDVTVQIIAKGLQADSLEIHFGERRAAVWPKNAQLFMDYVSLRYVLP